MRLKIVLTVVGAMLTLSACGGGANVISTEGPASSGTRPGGGVAVAMDCGRFPLPSLLREMKAAGYLIALVHVDGIAGLYTVPTGRADRVYTSVSVTYQKTYTGAEQSPLYVVGGGTGASSTRALGPAGVVPGEDAVVMVPPEKMRSGEPAGWIETALPVRNGFAFAGDTCWKSDGAPRPRDATWQVGRLDSGQIATPATQSGFTLPIEGIAGILSGG